MYKMCDKELPYEAKSRVSTESRCFIKICYTSCSQFGSAFGNKVKSRIFGQRNVRSDIMRSFVFYTLRLILLE
jgi:hypothetical protein